MKRFRRFLRRFRAVCCCCLRPRCLCAAHDDTISQSSVDVYQRSGAVLPEPPQDDTDIAMVSSESQLKFEAEAPAEPSGASSQDDLPDSSEGMKTLEDLNVPVEPEVNLENEALPDPKEAASLSDLNMATQEELHVSTEPEVTPEIEALPNAPEIASLSDIPEPEQEELHVDVSTEPEEKPVVEALPNTPEVASLGDIPEPEQEEVHVNVSTELDIKTEMETLLDAPEVVSLSDSSVPVQESHLPTEPEERPVVEAIPNPPEVASLSDIPEPEQEEVHVNVSTELDMKTEMETLLDAPEVVSLSDSSVPVQESHLPTEPEEKPVVEALPNTPEVASLGDIPEPEQEEVHVNVSTELDIKTEMETLLDAPEVVSLSDSSVPVQEQLLLTEPEEKLEVEALPNPPEVSSLGDLAEPHKDIIQEESAQDPEPSLEKSAEQDVIASDEVDIVLPVSVNECIHRPFPVGLQDFRSCAVLGLGGFGTVLLAEYKERHNFFAIKAIKKAVTIQRKNAERLTYEQEIFQTVSSARHPFLVNLFASFHDNHYIYFVMEYAAGGDLLSNIDKIGGPFPQDRAVFYAACVVVALDFLHNNKIVHRDLKLENVVLDKDGFAKLTDFGLSKAGIGFGDRTETRLGTLNYMAPEMVTGQEYTRDVDWWSLGVLIYNMLDIKMPFGDDEGLYELMNRIVNCEVVYPSDWSPETISLISQLLMKDPTQRLGSSEEGAKDVMVHPFFMDIDWSKLLQKELRPPFLPPLSGPEDVSNFDQEFTSMDPVLPFPEGPALTEEEQEVFKVFDWVAEWAQ